MNTVARLNSDDYLDLYLFAKKMGDKIWQNEIMMKLRNVTNGRPEEIQSLDRYGLWENYQKVNIEIITLYRKLGDRSSNENDYLREKIMKLKQERAAIGRQMNLTKKMDDR